MKFQVGDNYKTSKIDSNCFKQDRDSKPMYVLGRGIESPLLKNNNTYIHLYMHMQFAMD